MQKEHRDKSWKEMGFNEKAGFLFRNITVEPILTFYILPNVIASLATQNLNLDKACRVNLNGTIKEEICDMIQLRTDNESIRHYEVEVQSLVVEMTYWQSCMRSSLPAILILFLGSFSDRSGRRKPFMLLPIAGELFTSFGLILCSYFKSWRMEVAGVIEAIFPALTGGWTTMFMAVYSYMGDITQVENRTVRLGIVNIFVQVAAPAGMLASGFLLHAVGFKGVFTIVTIMYVLGLLYGAIRLKETREPTKLQHNIIRELFNTSHVVDTFRVSFKQRPGNLRLRIMLVMILSITIVGPIHGEMAVGYLFARLRFQWNEVHFSFYATYGIVVNLIGTALAMCLFVRVMKMEDAMLGVIACVSKLIAGPCYAAAKTTTQFCLATLIDIVGGTSGIAMRSIASKLVPSEELGKINSLFGICEAIVPILYQPLYSFVYKNTLNSLPGAFFLVGCVLTLPTVGIFLYLYYLEKKDPLTGELSNKDAIKEIKTNEAFDMSEEVFRPSVNTKL